jgi:hypothetical protein
MPEAVHSKSGQQQAVSDLKPVAPEDEAASARIPETLLALDLRGGDPVS